MMHIFRELCREADIHINHMAENQIVAIQILN